MKSKAPTNAQEAEKFIRQTDDIEMRIAFKPGADLGRLTIKGRNSLEQKIVVQISAELPLHDKALYQEAFLALTQEAHRRWETLEHEE